MKFLLGTIEESQVGGKPYLAMIRDDGSRISAIERQEEGGEILSHQTIAMGGILAHLAIIADDHGAVMIHIAKTQVGSIEWIRGGKHAVHLALLIEAKASELVDGEHPDIALGIAIGASTLGMECSIQLFLDSFVLTRWNDRLHGVEVEHLWSFFEGYPKALIMVFVYIAATVAAQADASSAQPEVYEVVAIVAYQSATMGTNPHEAVRVLEYIIGKVIRHSRSHVEIAYVILTRHPALCISAQGND